MKFTANRLELLELSENVMKLANDNSPVEALKGIYLASDEDAGEISMIATNYEAAVFMKGSAAVSERGKIVINAKLLNGMLKLLSGEQVTFSAYNDTVNVQSGVSFYTVPYLSGEHYPKPVMPFPEETVALSGICSLAKKTVFAVSKDSSKPIMQCVCLKVKQNSAHAAACDGFRMVLVKGTAESEGAKEFLLPAESFRLLASVSTDEDVYDVGTVGNETVFTKKNMRFSIKRHSGSFIDTNQIVQSVKPKYSAFANAEAILETLDLISTGAGKAPVNILLTANTILMKCDGEKSVSSAETNAAVTEEMNKSGFYYNRNYLLKLFQVIKGKVKLEIDGAGMMLIKTKNEIYFQLPLTKSAVDKYNNEKAA